MLEGLRNAHHRRKMLSQEKEDHAWKKNAWQRRKVYSIAEQCLTEKKSAQHRRNAAQQRSNVHIGEVCTCGSQYSPATFVLLPTFPRSWAVTQQPSIAEGCKGIVKSGSLKSTWQNPKLYVCLKYDGRDIKLCIKLCGKIHECVKLCTYLGENGPLLANTQRYSRRFTILTRISIGVPSTGNKNKKPRGLVLCLTRWKTMIT